MTVFEALRRRLSTRQFEPDTMLLSREQIEGLILDACLSPSEFDLNPWVFIIVRDRERKEVLYQCCYRQQLVRDASASVIILGDTRGHLRAGEAVRSWVGQGTVAAQDAPRLEASIRSAYEGSEWARILLAVRNPSFVAMSMMLLATERGIATCPVVAFAEDALRRAFHIPARYIPVLILALGMPSTAQPQPVRTDTPAAVIFHEDMEGVEP